MKIITGIENVRIIGKEKGLTENIDALASIGHYGRYKEDLNLAKELGFRMMRVGVPWNQIEIIKGRYDWTWMDDYIKYLKHVGIEPILDPLHHVTIPSYLEGGFLSEEFVERYSSFFKQIVERYPHVKKYTIVNEPTVTTFFATKEGIWYPFATGEENHKKGIDNIYNIIYTLSHYLKQRGKEHWYIDACEYHYGTCESSQRHAEEKNNVFRFYLLDRLLFQESPAYISMLGLDYYAHCEFEWAEEGRVETSNPIGFAKIAEQYYERYKLPISLTETNIRGFTEDRQTWFKYMYKECLKSKVPIKYFCWYPFIDCTDWDTLVTQANGNIDPQGIIYLDQDFNRHESEFSENIKNLNFGRIDINEIREYDFKAPLDRHLKGFLNNKNNKNYKHEKFI